MGKSGAFFFFSYDRRFILKTLKKEEIPTLKAALFDYYNHITWTNPNSLLSRIYGIYEIQIE
jgi:1-phosphatidylinositol-4-phosphate 5-kinase